MYVRTSNIYVVTKRSNKTTVMHLSWKILHLTSTCLISLSGSSASHVVWTLCLSFFCFCFFFFKFLFGSHFKLRKVAREYREHLNTSVFNDAYVYTVHTHTEWALTFVFFFRIF